MAMFKKSEAYKEIKKELKEVGLLNKPAKIACISGGTVIYEVKKRHALHTFQIATDRDLLAKEVIFDLIEMKGIKFFKHSIFIDGKLEARREWKKCY